MPAPEKRPAPEPGDVVLGCVHRPSPFQAHVFQVSGGLRFVRPDGSQGMASWIMLCERCNAECLMSGGNPLDIPVGCDLTWTGLSRAPRPSRLR